MSDLTVALRLLANSDGMSRGLNTAQTAVTRFTSGAKREFNTLRDSFRSLEGRLASIGITIGALQQLKLSAQLDKSLTQIGQTAGATKTQMAAVRSDLFAMARQSGQSVEDLQAGFSNLIASGLKLGEAKETLKGVNVAMAVTGANAQTLSSGLTVAAQAFQFDLSKPNIALQLLDKMTVAGRMGNAELQNLSDIFARVGVNAQSAGMSFEQTLGFIEALSLVERNPERLATLTDSTLRVFTNLKYAAEAQKATKNRNLFFDAQGNRRNAFDSLADIKKIYDTKKTDKERALFIQEALGKADLDTIKGVKTLMQGDMLAKARAFTGQIGEGGGTLMKNLPDAVNQAVDQTGRLKAALREAADGFAKPINQSITNAIKWALDTKNMSGGEMLGAGAGALALGYVGKRLIGSALGRVGRTVSGTIMGGLGMGKLPMPVYVVNKHLSMLPGSLGGGAAEGAAGAAGKSLAGRLLTRLAPLGRIGTTLAGRVGATLAGTVGTASTAATGSAVALAGGVGYGIGTLIDKRITKAFGGVSLGEKLYDWFNPEKMAEKVEVKNTVPIVVHINDGRITTTSNDPNTRIEPSIRRGRF